MKTRTELMNKINNMNTQDIKIEAYTGFSFLHIDLNYKERPVLWCAISCSEDIQDDEQLELKISDINDVVFTYQTNAKEIIEKLIEICKTIGVVKIYGRITVKDSYDTIEKFYKEFGFDIVHTPKEKAYDSAKISLKL